MTRENILVTRCLKIVRDAGGYAIKVHGGPYTPIGTPDIIACVEGRTLVVECKVGGGKPTGPQQIQLRKWREAGAITLVIHDYDTATLETVVDNMKVMA